MSERAIFEVGQRYRVPCVLTKPNVWPLFGRVLPVMGPLHEDREIIQFEDDHWHVDWRFASSRKLSRFLCASYYSPEHIAIFARPISLKNVLEREPHFRELKCHRVLPEFPLFVGAGTPIPVPWMPELERAFAGSRLKGGVCPHRGIDLSTMRANAEGIVVCPGHGLAWNRATGELHPRATRAEMPGGGCAGLNVQRSTSNVQHPTIAKEGAGI